MKRVLLAIAFLVAAAGSALAGSLPAVLRPLATIESDTVKLGDLWDNVGDKAQVVVAPAPQPGKRVTVDARWLTQVAQNFGVNWQPANPYETTVIERASQIIDGKLVESELREALAAEGVPAPFEFEITNRSAMAMVVPTGSGPIGLAIRDVVWDQRTQRFSATIEAPAGAPNAQRQRLNGHVFSITRIPVLSHAMNRGEVIGERDIDWVEFRSDGVRRDIVTDVSQLIGLEPRATLRQGAPIRAADLQRPILVARNSNVTMIVRTPYMRLTTQGRAVDEGGKGDLVRVTNINSKRVVEAVVEGPGQVVVTPNGSVALAN